MVECFECKGTGSTVPDCPLCEGYRSVSVKRAYAKGWKKADLPAIEDDGYCECPECYDDACTCMFCYGDGRVSQLMKEQQRNRVLIAAKSPMRIPPCFDLNSLDGRIDIDKEIYLLSSEAAGDCKAEGLINWFYSVFGDEIYLTPKGEEEARKAWQEYRAICRQWIKDERERRLERSLVALFADHPRVQEEMF